MVDVCFALGQRQHTDFFTLSTAQKYLSHLVCNAIATFKLILLRNFNSVLQY